jgi:RNA polymerase sigma factor (sigma-70 family)
MTRTPLSPVVRQLRRLAGPDPVEDASDADLLGRFRTGREERAFAALVRRHGPLVWGVCWQVLHHRQDAEDAFQGTFLLLARHAGSIRDGQALASWLYRAAYRVATKAGQNMARRRAQEQKAERRQVSRPEAEAAWREMQACLQEEVERLPEKYRAPFILCCLEGHSGAEAARLLGWKEGTVTGRLSEARKLLQRRLAHRGVLLSAVLSAAAVGRAGAAAACTALAEETVAAALSFTAHAGGAVGAPARAAALAAAVGRQMLAGKLKVATAVLLLASVVAGAGLMAREGTAAAEGTPAASSSPPAARKTAAPRATPGAVEQDGITLRGRVLDPDGRPLAGASLYLLGGEGDSAARVRATSEADGRFHLRSPRDGGPLFATADGYGPAWYRDFGKPTGITLQLVRDDVPVVGRILDLQGKPVAGVKIKVNALKASPTGRLDAWLAATRIRNDGLPVEYEYLPMLSSPALVRLYPGTVTDRDGRFRLQGVGRERVVALIVEGPAIETAEINAATRRGMPRVILPWYGEFPGTTESRYHAAEFAYVAAPSRPVVGVVRDLATGRPVAGAVVRAQSTVGNPLYRVQTKTGADGRYRLTGLPKGREGQSVGVVAQPPPDQPYLAVKKAAAGPGLEPVHLDFDLKRGVWVEGRVTDKATGRGVESLMLYYVFRHALAKGEDQSLFIPAQGGDDYRTDKQGRFRFVAYPGRGLLGARAVGDTREHYGISIGAQDIKGGDHTPDVTPFPTYPLEASAWDADAWKEVRPAAGPGPVTCDFFLDPGRTLQVHIEGPDGKPLGGALVHGQFARESWGPVPGTDLTLGGLEPGKGRTLLLQHRGKGLAGVATIPGDKQGGVVARLQPAASVSGRLLDDEGRPWRHAEITVRFTLKEWPGWVFQHAPEKVRTDTHGRFRIDGLAPGMQYYAELIQGLYPREVFPALSLTAGQNKDLGDVTPTKNPGAP